MKTKILLPILLLTLYSQAQTPINKSIPITGGQKIEMHFDYPKLIKITTWEKNEIAILGSVTINGGENDNAFVLENATANNVITIRNEIKNLKDLPHRITIQNGVQKISFKNQAEFDKYQQEQGHPVSDRMSTGVDMDIQIEIKVPRNIETKMESIYGMVEVKDFAGQLTIQAPYGGVDAAVVEKSIGELTAKTNYGEIYSNLAVKFSADHLKQGDFQTLVFAKPGLGPHYYFESKYGNIYLRKI